MVELPGIKSATSSLVLRYADFSEYVIITDVLVIDEEWIVKFLRLLK